MNKKKITGYRYYIVLDGIPILISRIFIKKRCVFKDSEYIKWLLNNLDSLEPNIKKRIRYMKKIYRCRKWISV